jgi:hypothetical protein
VGVINGIKMVGTVCGKYGWWALFMVGVWAQSTIMVGVVHGRCAWLACGRSQL